jgi:hypothetical protein
MGLVARYNLELLAAVRPSDLDALPGLVAAARDHGVRLGLWPMLSDADGRWVSAATVDRFDAFVRRVLDRCGPHAPAEVAFDLEPPFGVVSRWLSRTGDASGPRLRRASLAVARDALAATIACVRDRGAAPTAAVVPMVLFDAPRGRRGPWQRALGTPVDGLPWAHVSVMAYTTMFEGWSLGAMRRGDAVGLLAHCCERARARYGDAAGVSLGAVDTGALGDEPVYRSPSELARDVAVATACGVHDLTLFDLAGALRRGPAEAWLEAFTAPAARAPVAQSARARLVAAGAAMVGRLPF